MIHCKNLYDLDEIPHRMMENDASIKKAVHKVNKII